MNNQKNAKNPKLRAVLTFIAGSNPNQMIKLRRDATIFGREKGDILVEDNEISSTHCQIQEIDGVYHIFDMNSTNGTFVNNERIIKAKLKEGDIVSIGKTKFQFSLMDEKNVRNVSTMFRSASGEKSRSSSVIETLIESELRSTQSNGIKLKVRYSNGLQEIINLNQRVVYIGRASSFGHFDQDVEISRKHLLIKLNNTGEVFIEDQGSTNGSFLNDKKIRGMHQVNPNDTVRVGDTEIQIEVIA